MKVRKWESYQKFDAAAFYVLLAAFTIVASASILLLLLRVALAIIRLRGVKEYFFFLVLNREFWVGCVSISGLLAIEGRGPNPRTYKRVLFQCGIFIFFASCLFSRFPGVIARRYGKQPKGWNLPLVLTPNKCADICRGQGHEWCATECTNAWGFRGNLPDIAQRPKKTKVLLIGDSFVYGSGVKDAGRLDVTLQGFLMRHAPARRWEVSNFALPGLNFYSYVRIAEAVAPRFRPDFIVIGFLKCSDLEEMDSLGDIEVYGKHLYQFAQAAGIPQDIEMIARDRYACWKNKDNDASPSADITAKFNDSLSRLLKTQKRLNFKLIVFSYFGPTTLFAEAQRDGDLRVLYPPDPSWQFSKELLAIPHDGHPTAAGNMKFSQQLGDAILSTRL